MEERTAPPAREAAMLLEIERASAQNQDALAGLFDVVPPLAVAAAELTRFHRALARQCAAGIATITLLGFHDGRPVGYTFALTDRSRFFLALARRHPWLFLRHLGGHTIRAIAGRLFARARHTTNMPLLSASMPERAVYMQTTGTRPDLRGLGIGSRLKAAMVETAKAERYTMLYSQMQPEKGAWARAANRDGWRMERQPDGTFMGVYVIRREGES
ncbi:MAG: hypothetical protein HYV93_01800 [Candidatus Rokubacteria bacterium]|nr:hypothetical protein [Candidatus Rokubacteria bacterium]